MKQSLLITPLGSKVHDDQTQIALTAFRALNSTQDVPYADILSLQDPKSIRKVAGRQMAYWSSLGALLAEPLHQLAAKNIEASFAELRL